MADLDRDIREIRDDIKELVQNTSEMLGHFRSHVNDKSIHHNPPCRFHDSLTARLWALAAGVLVAVGGSAWSIIQSHK